MSDEMRDFNLPFFAWYALWLSIEPHLRVLDVESLCHAFVVKDNRGIEHRFNQMPRRNEDSSGQITMESFGKEPFTLSRLSEITGGLSFAERNETMWQAYFRGEMDAEVKKQFEEIQSRVTATNMHVASIVRAALKESR